MSINWVEYFYGPLGRRLGSRYSEDGNIANVLAKEFVYEGDEPIEDYQVIYDGVTGSVIGQSKLATYVNGTAVDERLAASVVGQGRHCFLLGTRHDL